MHKRFILRFFIGLGLFLLSIAVIIIIMDPFYHYHGVIGNMKAVLEERDYEVAGTLDHFSYDAVILGSSTAENYNTSQFQENFGTATIKAIRASGSNADLLWYLDRAFKNQNLEKVFYFMEYFAMESSLETTYKTFDSDFITNNNPFDDVQYIFNKDVLFKKIPLQIAYSYFLPYDEGEAYSWYRSKTFSREEILKRYYPQEEFAEMDLSKELSEQFYQNAALLEEKISGHPETEFYIVFAPISILWWDSVYRDGSLPQKMQEAAYLVETLEKYSNVKIYYYQDIADYVTDLDKYMDTVHFSQQVNREICDLLAEDVGRVDSSSLKEKLETLYNMTETFSRSDIQTYYPECSIE